MSKENLSIGGLGEDLAADYLKANGYKILFRNYHTKLGEIDIVAKEKGVVCFVEVKCRRSKDFGLPQESVNRFKQRQISKAALSFLKEKGLLGASARFDVISVLLTANDPKIELIRNAFELEERYLV